jgi:hypothetical protein
VLIGVVAHIVLLDVGFVASLFFATDANANRALTLWGWLDRRRAEAAIAQAQAAAPATPSS